MSLGILKDFGVVTCRIGSLEILGLFPDIDVVVTCRIGSLEIFV